MRKLRKLETAPWAPMTQLMLGCLRGAGVTAEEHSMAPLGNLTICLTRRTQTQGHCQSRVRQVGTKFWRNFKLQAVGLKEVLVTWRGTLEGGLSGDENPGPAPPHGVLAGQTPGLEPPHLDRGC